MVSNSIFYLDNVATDGILRVELSSSITQAMGFGLYAVDGLKAGVQDTGATNSFGAPANATVSMTTDSGFYVHQAARNNQSLADSVDDYETLYNYSVDNYRGLAQYQVTAAAGDYLAPVNNTGANAGGAVAAAFEAAAAVPEPSSIALLGLGGLALILRRRR
ncbi:PEP-CTERM sorting domain-containing protein [Akkermansiaceae bacterium]|nr:PEP-CTERM sorting domain-containing protein [Akkermansiaceae bacterium]